jgi:hypothetical protein
VRSRFLNRFGADLAEIQRDDWVGPLTGAARPGLLRQSLLAGDVGALAREKEP